VDTRALSPISRLPPLPRRLPVSQIGHVRDLPYDLDVPLIPAEVRRHLGGPNTRDEPTPQGRPRHTTARAENPGRGGGAADEDQQWADAVGIADTSTEANNTHGDPLTYPWSGPASGPPMRLAAVSAVAGGALLAAPRTPNPCPRTLFGAIRDTPLVARTDTVRVGRQGRSALMWRPCAGWGRPVDGQHLGWLTWPYGSGSTGAGRLSWALRWPHGAGGSCPGWCPVIGRRVPGYLGR